MRRFLIILLLLCAGGGALYGARASVLPWAARWLDVGEKPTVVDYVYVLGGDLNTKPLVAAAIYRAGLAKKVLVSHVDFEPGEDNEILVPQHKQICAVLRRRGVPEQDMIVVGNRHRTTHDEATSLAAYRQAANPQASISNCRSLVSNPQSLASNPQSPIPNPFLQARTLVVTSDYHTRRARWIFRQVLPERAAAISFVSAPVDGFGANDWWRNEQGFTTIVGENVKLLASLLFYWPVACALGLIAMATILAAITFWRLRGREHGPR